MKLSLIAGEPSGDALGAALMDGLGQIHPGIAYHGVGGPQMQAQGLDSLFPMEELSVFGIAEVLPKYRHLKRRIRQVAEAVLATNPDALITIDSPDFCLRVARLVKAARPDLKTIHYVAPTVWAWRPGRAQKMAQVIDHVLALFPFEPPYMTAAGMGCDFVGHPVATKPQATAAEIAAFRGRYHIAPDARLLLVLPGSRRGEVARLTKPFGEVVGRLNQHKLQVILPTLPHLMESLRHMTANWAQPPLIVDVQSDGGALKRAVFGAADAALAASGTVSLELAAAGVPMVIAYDMNWMTWQIMSRMALMDSVTLVNLVSESRAVPEFLGPQCQPSLIAPALDTVLEQPEAQLAAMALTMQRLGQGGEAPGLRAARAVLAVLDKAQQPSGGQIS